MYSTWPCETTWNSPAIGIGAICCTFAPGAICVTAAVMASRTAGVTELAVAGAAPASAIAAGWSDEQALAATAASASAQRSFSMIRIAPWRAERFGRMLARGTAQNRAPDAQNVNVNHQHPPNSVMPKSRVAPSAVEISK